MDIVNNPHDKFFKETMTDLDTAKSFLENYLPSKLLKLIDLDNMEIEKDSFIEEELEETFSDILYKVRINEKEAYLYFLFEHKSYPYKQITLQLLKYMSEIWKLKGKQNNTLPVVIPLVIYHGNKSWDIGMNLSDQLEEIPSEAERYIPDFEYLLYDLSRYSDEEIKGSAKARVFLELLKYIFRDDFKDKLLDTFEVLEELRSKEKGIEYFETVVKYIMSAQESLTETELENIAGQISSERSEEIMTIAEKLKKEGKIEMAKNLLKSGVELNKIAEASGLSREEIKKIKKDIEH